MLDIGGPDKCRVSQYRVECIVFESCIRKIDFGPDRRRFVPGDRQYIRVLACRKNIRLLAESLTDRHRVSAGARVDVKHVLGIAQIYVLIDEIGKTLGPIVLDVKVSQKSELLLRLRHKYYCMN